jgi:trehalose/maltose hydrolase-like predicted phosphorylase
VPSTELFTINGVLPLDESHGIVNSSAFVNAIVKQALSTPGYVYSLENKTTADFSHFAERIVIPLQDAVHPAYDGYASSTTISRPDAVLLGYPLLIPMTEQVRKNDLQHYEKMLITPTSSMTWAMHTIGWLEVGDQTKAESAFRKQLSFIQNEFQVWSNTTKSDTTGANVAYNYLSAMGTFLQSLVNGYGGMRLRHSQLDLNPILPPGITTMTFTGIDYLGSHIDITVTADEVSMVVTSTDVGASPLKVCIFSPEEVHSLTLREVVKFRRRQLAVFSSDGPFPSKDV